MKLGIAIPLLAVPGGRWPVPSWQDVKERAVTAERIGFDLVVIEDALSWPTQELVGGAWESVSLLGGLAEATSTIRIGHSVLNAPYRPPGLVASIATTLDEMSGGRYVLGIGAGNTPDADYVAFNLEADHRYTRFVEGLEVVHHLVRHGHAEVEGRFHRADDARLVLRGPREQGPPIVVGAGGPRMKRAAARFADQWNWWTPPGDLTGVSDHLDELARACEEVGRDPTTLTRSLDCYFPLVEDDPSDAATLEALGGLAELGIDEVRCYLPKQPTQLDTLHSIEAMTDVVAAVHRG